MFLQNDHVWKVNDQFSGEAIYVREPFDEEFQCGIWEPIRFEFNSEEFQPHDDFKEPNSYLIHLMKQVHCTSFTFIELVNIYYLSLFRFIQNRPVTAIPVPLSPTATNP